MKSMSEFHLIASCIIFLLTIQFHMIFSHPNPRLTTYDEAFEDLFQVEHIREGDNLTYPTYHKFIRLKYKAFVPDTGSVFDSSSSRPSKYLHTGGESVYEFQFKKRIKSSISHVSCWKETIPRMSKGERILITCPSAHAFHMQGLINNNKYLVKPGEIVSYDIEMVEANFDPFNIKVIKNGSGPKPRKMDILMYQYEVWVDEDREHIITKIHIKEIRIRGSVFQDGFESICLTEALRDMTVGSIVELYCPEYYRTGSKNFPEFAVPHDADLGYRIELLELIPREKTEEHNSAKID